MATRKAVAASIAASIIFSSLIVSNFVVYSGAAEDFRLVSLATEERAYGVQATLLAGLSLVDLLDGSQELLSSGHFSCSSATNDVSQILGSELVRLESGGLDSSATMSLAQSEGATDDLGLLRPFNGSVPGWTDMEATVVVQGTAPDGTLRYHASEQHLLNVPLRLGSLTARCLDAEAGLLAALAGLGGEMCNSTALAAIVPPAVGRASDSAAADGFELSVSYFVSSAQPCRVSYWITAQQQGIQGPEGAFTFTEQESGQAEG